MYLRLVICLASFALLCSCNRQDPILPEESQDALIELQFSPSPIDLQGAEASFAAEIAYDQYDQTTFDIYLPTSSTPTGLVVFIHGGGFTGGDKTFLYSGNYDDIVAELLNNGIAVATINYRLLESGDQEGVLKSLNDSRRAIQYIRYAHEELNIDNDNIVLFGTSAGASTALWLATNDELADNSSADLVEHESSRVKGIALNATQSSLDIETRWLGDVFVDFGTTFEDILEEVGSGIMYNFYGVDTREEYETPEVEAYRKQVDMLAMLSSDDPEIWVTNTGGHNDKPETTSSLYHHPFHAREIKEFADAAGVANVATYGNPILYSDPLNEELVEFLKRKIGE